MHRILYGFHFFWSFVWFFELSISQYLYFRLILSVLQFLLVIFCIYYFYFRRW